MMRTDLDKARIGMCENCHTEKVYVRRIKSVGADFGSGSRGNFDICFDCFGPVRYWNGPRGSMETPLDWDKEKVQKYLQERGTKAFSAF